MSRLPTLPDFKAIEAEPEEPPSLSRRIANTIPLGLFFGILAAARPAWEASTTWRNRPIDVFHVHTAWAEAGAMFSLGFLFGVITALFDGKNENSRIIKWTIRIAAAIALVVYTFIFYRLEIQK